MRLKKFKWEDWLVNPEKVEKSFNFYLKNEMVRKEKETDFLSASHLKKAEYNLSFINFLLEQKKFYDWCIIGCYYSIYHSSLALITKKGFSSKNHLATLCALIKFYYENKDLNKKDIELVYRISLEKEEIGYFSYAKEKRETASYGLSLESNKDEAEDLSEKTVQFLNKCREILE
mgnify:CR=1 FL=1